MTTSEMVRAWRDQDFFLSLSPAQRAQLPAHPAGDIDVARAELDEGQEAVMGTFGAFQTPYCSPCPPVICY